MSQQARAFWLAVISCGFLTAAWTLWGWRPQIAEIGNLGLYILAAIVTSGFKVRLPGIFSTLSLNFIVIIAALTALHHGDGVLVGTAAALAQIYYTCQKRPELKHMVFNVANVWLSLSAAQFCLEQPFFRTVDRLGVFSIVSASLAYFAVNTWILSGIIGLTSGKAIVGVWKESYLWTSPQYMVGGLMAGCFRMLADWVGWAGVLITFPVIYLMHRSYTIYLARLDEQQKHIREMADLHLRTIEALAMAIDAKDDTTAAHLQRVQVYATEMAREMGVSPVELRAIEAAALLHDIGKLAVPEHIISKPGRLTPDEFEKMKIHPIVGAEILERVNFPYPVVPIVRSHHEKFDGTGYPDGLSGEQIPIGARILSAVDCLDALASDRQYRKALPLDEAIRIIVSESGKSYDPRVVKVLAERYQDLERKARSAARESVTREPAKISIPANK